MAGASPKRSRPVSGAYAQNPALISIRPELHEGLLPIAESFQGRALRTIQRRMLRRQPQRIVDD